MRSRRKYVFPPEEGGDHRIMILGDGGTMRFEEGIEGFEKAAHARRFIIDNPELFLGKRFAIVLFEEIGRLDEEVQRSVKLYSRPKHAAQTDEDEADGPEDAAEAPGSS